MELKENLINLQIWCFFYISKTFMEKLLRMSFSSYTYWRSSLQFIQRGKNDFLISLAKVLNDFLAFHINAELQNGLLCRFAHIFDPVHGNCQLGWITIFVWSPKLSYDPKGRRPQKGKICLDVRQVTGGKNI